MKTNAICILIVVSMTGCSSTPTVDQKVAEVLNQWVQPPGVTPSTDQEQLPQSVGGIPYDEIMVSSPLVWPDFKSVATIRKLIDLHGETRVITALRHEYRDSASPRRCEALTLLSMFDPNFDVLMDEYFDAITMNCANADSPNKKPRPLGGG